MKALALCVCGIAMIVAGQAGAAGREDPADPQSSAIEIAMSIGQLQALAELCAAPSWSYETALNNASYVVPKIYADAGLKDSEADADIAAGHRAEVARRDDPSWPLDCNRFRHQVSYVVARVAEATGQSVPKLIPVDRSDWRNHPPGGGDPEEPAPRSRILALPTASPEPPPTERVRADDSYRNDIP